MHLQSGNHFRGSVQWQRGGSQPLGSTTGRGLLLQMFSSWSSTWLQVPLVKVMPCLGMSGRFTQAAQQSCEADWSPVASSLGKLRQRPRFLSKGVPV